MPLLSQGIKKQSTSEEVLCFLSFVSEKELVRNPRFYWVLPSFSLHFYYNIKKHSLQYKNAESSHQFYNGNAKQTPAKLQPLSNNI